MVVVILGIAPPFPPAPAAIVAAAASSRFSVLVAAPALLLLEAEPNDTHVDAPSLPLSPLSVRSSSGSNVCALL